MNAHFPSVHLLRCSRGFFSCSLRKKLSDGTGEMSSSSAKAKQVRVRYGQSSEERKKTIINWHKTNQMLFGPVVDEKNKNKTKEAPKQKQARKTEKRHFKPFKKAEGSLIPISIWQTISPQTYRARRIIQNKSKVIATKEYDVCNFESSLSVDSQIVKVNNSQDSEQTSKNEELTSTLVKPFSHLPQTPFYVENEIFYPFPFVISKPKQNMNIEEIISVPSQNLVIPSVTEVLSKTRSEASELALATWRKKKIAEVGEDGLEEFMREAKNTGTSLHMSIETCLRGVQYENVAIDPRISGHWLSLKNILKEVNNIVAVESYVVHPFLQYKGFIDCVAHYRGSLVVVDWKTSQRIKTTLASAYDDPVQIAAYIGALNADDNYPFEVENALLVVAYPTGRPADVLYLNREECNRYWVEWLKRLELYEHRKKHGLLKRPLFT